MSHQRENAAKTKDSQRVKHRYYGEALTSFSAWKKRSIKKGERKPTRGERKIRKPQQFKVGVDAGSDGKQ